MTPVEKRRVFLADDHQVFVKGLQALLEKASMDVEIAGTAVSGEETVEKIRALASSRPVDVALVDIKMPGMNGIETTRMLKKEHPQLRIIILTTFNEGQFLRDCFLAGADGFLLKDEDEEGILRAIMNANPLHFLISRDSFLEFISKAPIQSARTEGNKILRLSPKHQEVFYLLIHGKDNAEIAKELFLSEKTVRNYVSHIYDTLEVTTRTQLILWAQENNLR
jgi:DNA-binding NarL/FixJ family response regulator